MFKKATAAALVLALAATPLVACGNQQTDSESGASAAQTAAIDPSTWKTLGDSFALGVESRSAGWDDNHYVSVFQIGDSYFRVVAKMDEETSKRLDDVDYSKEDAEQKAQEVLSNLVIESAEDLTDELVSQDELNAYVGKTGKDLVDAGFTFQDYNVYGESDTGAGFVKGDFCYLFMFDVSITDDQTSDEGASVMDAKVTEAQYITAADTATDPSKLS